MSLDARIATVLLMVGSVNGAIWCAVGVYLGRLLTW